MTKTMLFIVLILDCYKISRMVILWKYCVYTQDNAKMDHNSKSLFLAEQFGLYSTFIKLALPGAQTHRFFSEKKYQAPQGHIIQNSFPHPRCLFLYTTSLYAKQVNTTSNSGWYYESFWSGILTIFIYVLSYTAYTSFWETFVSM